MNFVNATLKSIKSLEEINIRDSKLHNISAESKIVSLIILLILMIILNSVVSLSMLLLFLIFEALIFERSVFKTWIFVPLFTGIIAIPAIFITPGTPIAHFGFIVITYEGVLAAIHLTLRTLIAVTCVALLTKTTPWEDILESLRLLRIPELFILILFLTFRYIFFLARITEATLLSLKSRMIGKEKIFQSWKMYAPLVGNLFIKSYEMQEKIYIAMNARGFNLKKDKVLRSVRRRGINWGYVAVFIFLAFMLLWIDGDLIWILPSWSV